MANEYLQRTPTSTGNARVWTWSGWLKLNDTAAAPTNIFMARTIAGGADFTYIDSNAGEIRFADDAGYTNNTARKIRDSSGWFHLLCNLNTTSSSGDDRMNIYINGVLETNLSSTSNPVINYQATVNTIILHTIGNNSNGQYGEYNIADVFLVDGQALTPDVFGFNKQGKGYISAGSTQATDFRPGQWVPKTPRVIKTEINRRGGFGVNGFYLPMNDSNNFGADFHGDPNSIITLNEKLPQPRVGVASTAAVGLGYTDVLRVDPYAANLVLALPFVSGGLNSGFGDYAPSIKVSGSAKTITNSNVSIATTASYYGNAASFNGTSGILTTSSNTDFYFTGTFTIECWVNWNGNATYYQNFIGCNKQSLPFNNNAAFFRVWGTSAPDTSIRSRIGIGNPTYDGSGSTYSGSVTLPTNQWTHVAATRDSTNTMRVFMNGICVGIKTSDTSVYDFSLEGTAIGQGPWDGAQGYYSGLMQDLRVYKGVAKYTGGFDVPRPYTPVGIATWRQVPDTTANNFATWNPVYPVISGASASYTNGNLTVSDSSSSGSQASGTIGISTGKWYYEARATNVTASGSSLIGIRPAEWFTFNPQNRTSYRNSGDVYNDAANVVQSGTTYTTGDIIGVAFDMNNRRLWFSKNGSWVYSGDPNNNLNPAVSFASTYTHYTPAAMFDNVAGTEIWDANFGQNPTFSGNTTAGTFTDTNGKGLFKYQPPSGFLVLCEDNLPTPAISDPGKYFKTVLWTGDNANSRSIVGVGFTPDLVWIKSRNSTAWHALADSVRGSGKNLFSNTTNAESGNGIDLIGPFNSDGFNVSYTLNGSPNGTTNESAINFVAWCWRAGAGTTSTNTNGSITSVVSVNQDAGFSIVSYIGNGVSNATVGHGLNKAPSMVIIKNRSEVRSWIVYHRSASPTPNPFNATNFALGSLSSGCLSLNLTNGTFTYSMDGQTNGSGSSHIAYCWAEIEGFSKFGSYVGNGNADGPFVYCGFKPALVIIKCSSDAESWYMYDSSRKSYNDGSQHSLFPNLADIESTGWPIDFLSNGFKNRYVGATNNSGRTYIFAAWAESPFTTSNSK